MNTEAKPVRDEFNFDMSQSIIKDYNKYAREELCGIVFYEKTIKRNPIFNDEDPSEPIALGNYFEYLITGQTSAPEVPTPEVYKINCAGGQKGDPKPEWVAVQLQAKRAKIAIEQYGLRIVEANAKHRHDGNVILLDLRCVDQSGNDVIIDFKYTSKLNKRAWDNGWDLRTLHETDHLVQAKHTKAMWQAKTGKSPRFMFYIASSTDPDDVRFFEVNISDWTLEEYLDYIKRVRSNIELEATVGFKPYPNVKRCNACPLLDTCEHKTLIPLLESYDCE